MTPDDLADLHARCFTHAPRPWTAAEFAEIDAHPARHLVGDDKGFAVIGIAGAEAELLTICIDPSARGQGRGRALLARAEASARREGADAMILEVSETNAVARALYASAGYVEAGYRRDYYRINPTERISAIVLSKAI